ncbi:HIT family protein [Rhodococcus sp. UNC23MFCrub1.1]|uniref:HIT family protein n=1 Tax=Rhodococcus sp. UNC23MFCrub1.1 TaxID=1449068 RepID=UPI0009E0011E
MPSPIAATPAHGCAFCLIANGDAPAREILRTSQVLAFLPDVPAVLGHVLVIPYVHIPDIFSLDTATAHVLADTTRHIAAATRTATGASGVNIIQSNGSSAGQTVFHLHIHIVPRLRHDRMPDLWPSDARWPAADLDSNAKALRAALHGSASPA